MAGWLPDFAFGYAGQAVMACPAKFEERSREENPGSTKDTVTDNIRRGRPQG